MKKQIRIVLPFPLPTWNRILAMHPMERKRMRDWIHIAVANVVAGRKISELELMVYDALIRPKKVSKVRRRKTRR